MSLVHALAAWVRVLILAAAFTFTVHLLQVARMGFRLACQGLFSKGPVSYPGFLLGSVEHVGWAGGKLTHCGREDTAAEN